MSARVLETFATTAGRRRGDLRLLDGLARALSSPRRPRSSWRRCSRTRSRCRRWLTVISLTSLPRASGPSWSPCGASLWSLVPPVLVRNRSEATAPEQAMFKRRSTGSLADSELGRVRAVAAVAVAGPQVDLARVDLAERAAGGQAGPVGPVVAGVSVDRVAGPAARLAGDVGVAHRHRRGERGLRRRAGRGRHEHRQEEDEEEEPNRETHGTTVTGPNMRRAVRTHHGDGAAACSGRPTCRSGCGSWDRGPRGCRGGCRARRR